MDYFMSVLDLFPPDMRGQVSAATLDAQFIPEEIRMRVGGAVRLRKYGQERECCSVVTKSQMMYVVGCAAEGSYHAAAQYIRQGYLPLRGGGRMGLCGIGDRANGVITSFRDIESICIRIPKEAKDCAGELYDTLYGNGFINTVIIAPPGLGKTTLLRELIRKLSYDGKYVGVADERGEIAGMYGNRPSFDLGPRCDVLSGVSKSSGAMMLVRTMNPHVIAMDEITAYHDASAIMEAVGCGVGLLTTMHGNGLESLRKPAFRPLYDAMVFEWAVMIEVKDGRRCYRVERVYD